MWFLVESDQIATFNLPIYQKIVPRFCLANNDLKWIMVCMVSQNRVWPRKGRWFMIDQIIVESPHGSRLHCCHVPFAHKLLLLSNLLLCYLSIYLTHITELQMYYLDLSTYKPTLYIVGFGFHSIQNNLPKAFSMCALYST